MFLIDCFPFVFRRVTMVPQRGTIKGFALACMREAHDCNPSGYHGPPKGDNQGLRPCMVLNSNILTAKRLIKEKKTLSRKRKKRLLASLLFLKGQQKKN